MTREEIIQGLQFTIDMFLFDPSTGELITNPRNDMDKTTIDACKGAIKELHDNSYELWKESYEVEHERNIRLEEKIKALEQEPCEDAISRRAVLNTLNRMDSVLDENRTVETYKELLIACYNDLPLVTPPTKCIATVKFSKEDMRELIDEKMKEIVVERKKGKWINIDKTHSKCDKCESVFEIVSANGESNYCPNCGAEME